MANFSLKSDWQPAGDPEHRKAADGAGLIAGLTLEAI
jgi:hypothetical protein